MYRDEDIETLTLLGLTSLQAKLYLTLLTLGTATVKSVSKASNMARQDAYRIMPNLQKLGLVEKVVTNPATFKATPIRDGVSTLIQRKKQEFAELQKNSSALLSNRKENVYNEALNEDDDSQFAIIYERTLLYRKFWKCNETAEKSIDCSGTWPDIKRLISNCNCVDDLFTKAMKKGVRIRIVTENRGNDKSIDKTVAAMCKNPLFDIRFIVTMPVKIVLYDNKEANTSISTSTETDMPSLWSNNPNFVKIMINQFEEMWNSGTKFEPRKTAKVPRQKALNLKSSEQKGSHPKSHFF